MNPEDIRRWREMSGYSQGEAAAALGVSTRTIEDWESGRRNPPPYLGLAVAALLYGLPPWPYRP